MRTFSKEQLHNMLELPLEERINITYDVIEEALSEANKPIVQFSGGIDSCLLAWMVNKVDPKVPMVFNDWGIFLPRQKEFCEKFFKKYNMKYYIAQSGYDYKTFLTKYGFPIFKGVRPFITPDDFNKYNLTGKCRMLKNKAWKDLLKQYPADYYFVGILADESPQRKSLFVQHGFWSKKKDGVMVKPIELIKKQEVFDICKKEKILYPDDMYRDTFKGKTFEYNHCDLGCYMCAIRFKEYGWGRLGRLAREEPELFKETMDLGMRDSLHKIIADFPDKTKYIVEFLKEYDSEAIPKVAYDFDGVLMPAIKRGKSYFEQSTFERKLFERKKRYFFKTSKVLKRPIEPRFSIISARRERYREITENWLAENDIYPEKLILMEGSLTFNRIIDHKSKFLKEEKIEKYYEDDPKIVAKLRKLLPDIEIIQMPQTIAREEDIELPATEQLELDL